MHAMLYTSVILSNMVIAQRKGTEMAYMNVATIRDSKYFVPESTSIRKLYKKRLGNNIDSNF